MLSTVSSWKKDYARGQASSHSDQETPPKLLLGIDNTIDILGSENNKHQRVVERLEEFLFEDKDGSEFSEDSIEVSKDSENNIEMSDDVEDSTTLGKFQEGIRNDSFSQKGSKLQLNSHKK